ncbi:hypothetical protein BH09SUM1_BH09SUM1_10450 [soil metagenome]
MNRVLMFAFCALLAGVTACGGSKPKSRKLAPDPTFSLNVIEVPADWPDEKRDWPVDPVTSAQQQAVYEQNGKPDFFRILWNRDGRLMMQRELAADAWNKRNAKKPQAAPEMEWIYLDKAMTYQFKRGGVIKKNLPDNIRTVTEYGDPEEMKESVDMSGAPNLIYQYYNRGKVFYFREGKMYKEENQTPMPGMSMRR